MMLQISLQINIITKTPQVGIRRTYCAASKSLWLHFSSPQSTWYLSGSSRVTFINVPTRGFGSGILMGRVRDVFKLSRIGSDYCCCEVVVEVTLRLLYILFITRSEPTRPDLWALTRALLNVAQPEQNNKIIYCTILSSIARFLWCEI